MALRRASAGGARRRGRAPRPRCSARLPSRPSPHLPRAPATSSPPVGRARRRQRAIRQPPRNRRQPRERRRLRGGLRQPQGPGVHAVGAFRKEVKVHNDGTRDGIAISSGGNVLAGQNPATAAGLRAHQPQRASACPRTFLLVRVSSSARWRACAAPGQSFQDHLDRRPARSRLFSADRLAHTADPFGDLTGLLCGRADVLDRLGQPLRG